MIVGARARRAEAAPPTVGRAGCSGDPYIGPEPGGPAYAAGADVFGELRLARRITHGGGLCLELSAVAGWALIRRRGRVLGCGVDACGRRGSGASARRAVRRAHRCWRVAAAIAAPPAVLPLQRQASPCRSTLPRADFMVRMGALLIDTILVAVVLHALHSSHESQLIVLAIYGAIMWKLKGTTIGGIVFGLQDRARGWARRSTGPRPSCVRSAASCR